MYLYSKPNLICICFILTVLMSCKSNFNFDNNKVSIPDSFNQNRDTANSSSLKWNQFFKDENLIDLIEIGLQNNYDLLEASQNIEIAKNRFKIQESKLFPTLSGQLSTSSTKFGTYTADGAGNKSTDIESGQTVPNPLKDYNVGFYSSWEVDVWGKLRSQKKAAFSRFFAQNEAKKYVVTSIVAQISKNYYELLALEDELSVIEETIKLEQDALFILKVQKESGKANELAVKQFEAEISNTITHKFDIIQKIVETENKVNTLLGRYKGPVLRKSGKFTDQNINSLNLGQPSDLLQNRPDIKQIEYELLASKCDLKAAQKAFFPSFTLGGNIGFQAFKQPLLFNTPESLVYQFMGNLTAPLWNKSAIKNHFAIAKSEQINAYLKYQKSIITAFQEVDIEANQIANLEKAYQNKKNEVDFLSESILISNELFKSGKVNYMEVLMVQRSAFASKLELIETKKRQFHSMINLYKILGGGWR